MSEKIELHENNSSEHSLTTKHKTDHYRSKRTKTYAYSNEHW